MYVANVALAAEVDKTVFFLKAAGLWGGNGSSIGQTHQTLPTFAAFCAEAAKEVRFRSWRRS